MSAAHDHDYYVSHEGHVKPIVRDFERCGVPRVNEILEVDDQRFLIVAEDTVINGQFASTTFDVVLCPAAKKKKG